MQHSTHTHTYTHTGQPAKRSKSVERGLPAVLPHLSSCQPGRGVTQAQRPASPSHRERTAGADFRDSKVRVRRRGSGSRAGSWCLGSSRFPAFPSSLSFKRLSVNLRPDLLASQPSLFLTSISSFAADRSRVRSRARFWDFDEAAHVLSETRDHSCRDRCAMGI